MTLNSNITARNTCTQSPQVVSTPPLSNVSSTEIKAQVEHYLVQSGLKEK